MPPERDLTLPDAEQAPPVKQTPAQWARAALDRMQAPDPLRTEFLRVA